MKTFNIKSHVPGRVRFSSKHFTRHCFNELNVCLSGLFMSLRLNDACHSLILIYDAKTVSLETIVEVLKKELNLSLYRVEVASEHYCVTCKSCSSCDVSPRPNSQISWRRKLTVFALLSGYALYLFISETLLGIIATPLSLTALIAFTAAWPLFKEAIEDVKQKRFTLKTFMGVSLLGAIFAGEAVAAFEIIYILRGGMLLEEYTAERSRKEIHTLLSLDVKKAYILSDDVEIEVDLESVCVGDIVVSRSGEKIPVDGIIVEGKAEIDEASINGRSEPSFKEIDDVVYANTFVHKGRIYIKVSATGEQTYLARIIAKVEEGLANKSPSELAADRLAAKLLRLGTALTTLTYLVTGSFARAFAVMIVMSCPCATVLAASTAISAGIARGAKKGILIKGGEYLEKISQSNVYCFDKTGTLTTGNPIIMDIFVAEGCDEQTLLYYALMAEYRNSHPLARAIVEKAKRAHVTCKEMDIPEILPGLGVKLQTSWALILVGNEALLKAHKISTKMCTAFVKHHTQEERTLVYVSLDKKLLGAFALEHEVRPGTEIMLQGLRQRGVEHLVLLSGDTNAVAEAFAQKYGFDEVYANVMPEEKADVIDVLKSKYKHIVMVGDGINDTIAMSRADVAISFSSGGSEAAIEVSHIAITKSDPQDLLVLHDLSLNSLKVVNQNYWIGTSTNLLGVGLGAVGILSPVAAGAIHIVHTIGIMANSSRIALSK